MRATILFAHGSRDTVWRAPIDNVANRMVDISPQSLVRCAFLELTEPTLPTVVAELNGLGITEIVVIPMFLGFGKHARTDTPLLVHSLEVAYPNISFQLNPSVGEDSRVIELLARISLQKL